VELGRLVLVSGGYYYGMTERIEEALVSGGLRGVGVRGGLVMIMKMGMSMGGAVRILLFRLFRARLLCHG
jgi:hypothetical protein